MAQREAGHEAAGEKAVRGAQEKALSETAVHASSRARTAPSRQPQAPQRRRRLGHALGRERAQALDRVLVALRR